VAPGVVTPGPWDLRPAALTLAGFAVEAMTPTFRDRYTRVPGDPPPSLGTRARHAVGLRGQSVAVRARPVTGGRLPAAPDADR
jgi:hypothetical protein